ncbi:unnamed protein product [Caenorhabditis bovis]|uniref:Uncharacterized protein n=1 Tax=Caenorhabditis bovis TaxID=2654633 RepID=A0A8S1EA02_9PELO|nr:unnamed protein product [Caenorhabditis bovis]
MQGSAIVALVFLAIIAVSAVVNAAPQAPPTSCSVDERSNMPCVCCKKDCWYSIAAAATHELGHMPGEAGEREAMATLKLIRACMITECANVCLASPF